MKAKWNGNVSIDKALLVKIEILERQASRHKEKVDELNSTILSLEQELDIQKQWVTAIQHSIVDTVKGEVEGRPTNILNYLERVRELVRLEDLTKNPPIEYCIKKWPFLKGRSPRDGENES